MSQSRRIQIDVPTLARVEGEGALKFSAENGRITQLQLRIYEPPRMFEKLLEGRHYSEVPDIVARICGICPVAYQISAVQALEDIFQVEISDWAKNLRQIMYCGEWIQSHALHIHLLAIPDFFGYDSAIAMAEDYPLEVTRGLKLQSLGNKLITLCGGRSVHPVGLKVGGFHHAPELEAAQTLKAELEEALPDIEALIHWLDQISLPDDHQAFTCVALAPDQALTPAQALSSVQATTSTTTQRNSQINADYPIMGRQLTATTNTGNREERSKGKESGTNKEANTTLNLDIEHFQDHFKEHQQDYSTALHCLLDGQPYLVGPLARINLNYALLLPQVQQQMTQLQTQFPSQNMFHSVIARALELYQAILQAIECLENYQPTNTPYEKITVKAGTGFGCSEAPRGILWHSYQVDEQGLIKKATIVPPTSQNQARIEQDLEQSLYQYGLEHSDDELRLRAESVIRNYDPCISCATHFLKLDISR